MRSVPRIFRGALGHRSFPLIGRVQRDGNFHFRSFSTEGFKCPACGAPSSRLICRSCGWLQEPVSGINHFELLGVDATFEVDPQTVDTAYKDLQRLLHPDRHVSQPEAQRELADVHSAKVNEAVAVLRSPLRRAHYWMELNGQDILLEEQRIEDNQTMMEVMETSEELDDAKTQEEVDRIRKQNRTKIETVESELSSIFKQKDWSTARHRVERLQMLTRLQERMDDWRPK